MSKIQEFQSTTSAMAIGAYRFHGKNVVRAYGKESDIAQLLFAPGEISAPATIYRVDDGEVRYWAERTFRSRMAALTFIFGQAIRFGLQKRAWID